MAGAEDIYEHEQSLEPIYRTIIVGNGCVNLDLPVDIVIAETFRLKAHAEHPRI